MGSESLQLAERGKLLGYILAYASLACSASMWLSWPVHELFPSISAVNRLTEFFFFKVNAVGVVLVLASIACRCRLWKIALPVAVVMFFFIMYVMGS